MRSKHLAAIVVSCLAVFALPALAEELPSAAQEATLHRIAPALCSQLVSTSLGPEIAPACYIEVECSDSSIVSCSGNNTCSTSGTNNRCVTCDGQQQGCCTLTCCEQCQQALNQCNTLCSAKPWLCSNPPGCFSDYFQCTGGCSGGCF